MNKKQINIFTILIILLFCFNFAIACPIGQILSAGSCIPDPDYNSGSVSCADLIASTGKTAEELCNINKAGQCCVQEDTSEKYESDYGESIVNCATDDTYVTKGQCEIYNQYYQILGEVDDKVYNQLNTPEAYDLYEKMWAKQSEYRSNVYGPTDKSLQSQFNMCLKTDATNCYDVWKVAWDKINIAEANYMLTLVKQLNQDVDTLSKNPIAGMNEGSSGSGSSDSYSGSGGFGNFNTNDNRGRDEFGRMNPTISGYLGNAYVEREDGTKVIPGKELYLKVGDRILTEKDSKINIMFSKAGSMNLGPNTVVKVGNALLDQYYLAKGTLKTKLDWVTPEEISIVTSNANIITKGTEFVVEYNEIDNITKVYLNEGVLNIQTQKEEINLTAGNYAEIIADGTIWTNQLMPENWDLLQNNFLDSSSIEKIIKYVILTLSVMSLIVIVILRFWTDNKIKNLNKQEKNTNNKKEKSTSKGTLSLILGIMGVLFFLLPYIGVVLSAFALSFARIQKANNPTGKAKAGYILGIIGLILNGIIMIFMLIGLFNVL